MTRTRALVWLVGVGAAVTPIGCSALLGSFDNVDTPIDGGSETSDGAANDSDDGADSTDGVTVDADVDALQPADSKPNDAAAEDSAASDSSETSLPDAQSCDHSIAGHAWTDCATPRGSYSNELATEAAGFVLLPATVRLFEVDCQETTGGATYCVGAQPNPAGTPFVCATVCYAGPHAGYYATTGGTAAVCSCPTTDSPSWY